jgi:AcrR family transcriptional regulator
VKKPDRRKQRTRQLLRDALVSLILERGYDDVTVQHITDYANLGRATFYLHFTSKEDLLLSSLREMFDDLKAHYTDMTVQDRMASDLALRAIPFRHVQEYRDLYRVTLLNEQGTAAILKGIRKYIADSVQAQMEGDIAALNLPQPRYPAGVIANYMAGAMLALVGWWLENDMPYTPEEMAEMFDQLTHPVILAALGLQKMPEK